MKHEWKKKEKQYYLPKDSPELIIVPRYKFFCIEGKGNPNMKEFEQRVGALYQAAYGVRMMSKNGFAPEGFFEYTVYPLEGLWSLSLEGQNKNEFDKNELVYKLMIRQPDFVNDYVFRLAIENQFKKKKNILLKEITFEEIEDGLSVQMMHIGSYDDEQHSFNIMKEYINNHGLKLKNLIHREIYISDSRKVSREKLNTVLRYSVSKK